MFTIFVIIFFFVILVFLAIKIMSILNTKNITLKATILVVVFAALFTTSSLFWTRDTTYSVEVIKPLEYGWPVPFYLINHPMGETWATPVTIWNNFFGSIVINTVLWGAGLLLFSLLFRRAGVVVKSPSLKYLTIVFTILVGVIIMANIVKIIYWKTSGFEERMNMPVDIPSITAPSPVIH